MVPFLGFAPDLLPETQGVFTDCANILPSPNGFISGPSRVDAGLGTLPSQARGFSVVRKLDGTSRLLCGTTAKLYEVAGTWSDVSKGGGYSLGSEERWRFTQFGNVTVASAKSTKIQSSVSGAFADIDATAPKAAIVETINNQVFAFNTYDAGFGDSPNRWWCSAIGDETDWTPAIATQCASGQLLDTPGGITAGRRLGDMIVAYKEKSMFVGQYVGAPMIWSWQHVPGDIGAPSQESVVTTGTAHYFPGPDDFYVFDGSRPVRMNSPVRQWYQDNVHPSYGYRSQGTYDRDNARIFWWFASKSGGGVLDKCLVYHVTKNQWGRMDTNIEAAAEYVYTGVTYDGLGTLYATYNDLPTDLSYDSPSWTANSSVVAVFGTDHIAYMHNGTPGASSITTGHYGDSTQFSTINRIRPRFIVTPATTQCLYSYSNLNADNFTQSITASYNAGFYDLLWSARWHMFQFQFTGDVNIPAFDPSITTDGVA